MLRLLVKRLPAAYEARLGIGPLILGAAILLLLILVVYPLSTIAMESVNYEDQLSLANFREIIGKEAYHRAFMHSLEVSTLSTIFATIIGTFLAWLVGRTDLPGRGSGRPLSFPS